MNKKKRRKRSKAEIREVWREQNRKEQRTKEQPNREQREKEQREKEQRKKTSPPKPGDIASVKPSRYKAWCPSCRAHTHHKASTHTYQPSGASGPSGGSTTYTCLHCRGFSFVPWERLYWASTIGGMPAVILTIIAFVTTEAMFGLESSGRLSAPWARLITALSASSFAAVLCARLMCRFNGYRDWSQWAKEQKANKPS